MSQQYPVFIVRFTLLMSDPDMPTPRYHTTLFVETDEEDGSGTIHHVVGDITSSGGMSYESKHRERPNHSRSFYSMTQIPTPPQQKAFNVITMTTEPFKTKNPLTFYEPGEPRRPLVKCTEWTLERALPALKSAGLIH